MSQIKPKLIKSSPTNSSIPAESVSLSTIEDVYRIHIYIGPDAEKQIFSKNLAWAEGLYEDIVRYGWFDTVAMRDDIE
jgi:hypothetical protein